jgi:dTDP-4-dehydrorhamnose 3,5-epimerase
VDWTEGQIEGVELRPASLFRDDRGWLSEIYRQDETPAAQLPAMAYVSVTHPGVTRGPHAHLEQTDLFAFFGPGIFRVRLWDNRPESPTHGHTLTVEAGKDNPLMVTVPPGVVHGYTNIAEEDAWVINLPNRLFAGEGRTQPVDEVRYEDEADSPFQM